MEKDCFIKFTLRNSSDSAKEVYFFPGYYLKSLKLYMASPEDIPGTFGAVALNQEDSAQYSRCQRLTVGPHQEKVFFARFNFVLTNVNSYMPRIIEKDYLGPWVMTVKSRNVLLNVTTYVVCGILLLMIFYSLAVYLQNNSKEFLYYTVYALCSVVVLFLKSYLNFQPSAFNELFEEYLDIMILSIGIFFYIGFVRRFLNTKENHPFIDSVFRKGEPAIIGLLVVFSVIYFFTDKYIILNILENYVIKLFLFVLGIIFIVYSLRKRDPLLNYLAAGNISLVFFSMISLGIIVFKWRFFSGNSIFNPALVYYEAGLTLELMFFLSGLAYKNKRDIIEQVKERERFKRENERKEFEKQMAMLEVRQEERDRISADMHDDLGSGVTAIRLMSEIVKSKMNTEQYPEIDKISNSANELLGKMNTIIWTMKSSNDTLESLVAYIRAYAIEYFDGASIKCFVDVKDITEMEVNGEKRRNIFLSFKETLTNILKHSQASAVNIIIEVIDKKMTIAIQDNGIGIDMSKLRRFGNGLSNIKKRMNSIDGEFTIVNDNGTLVHLDVAL